tara:strand:- start:162 stop:710 length:549 start_codon:yes stop_codon:yes gene_type:complete
MSDNYINSNDIFYFYDSVSGVCRANACPPKERKSFLKNRFGEAATKAFNTYHECENDRHRSLIADHPMSHLCSAEGMCSLVQRECEEGEGNCYPTKEDCKQSCKRMNGWECSGNRQSPYYLVGDRAAFQCVPTHDAPGSKIGIYPSKAECEAMCTSEILSQTAIVYGERSLIHTTSWGPGVL